MSKMVEIDWKPDEGTLRQFGFIALVGFSFLAALAWFQLLIFAALPDDLREPVSMGLGGLALVSLVFSLVAPKANLPIYVGLTVIAYPIGFVLSYLIMGFLFFGMITPLGLIFRVIGKDPLNRAFEPEASTYWADPRPRRDKESYFRQF